MKPRKAVNKAVRTVKYRNNRGVIFCTGNVVGLTMKAFILPVNLRTRMKYRAGIEVHTAVIVSMLEKERGYVSLSIPLGGYHTWHVDELVKLSETAKKRRAK